MRNQALQKYVRASLCLILLSVCGCSLTHVTHRTRESAAIQTLKNFHNNQIHFRQLRGRFATLPELAESDLIDTAYASGRPINGYVYSDGGTTADTYCIQATRASGRAGQADFNVDEAGTVKRRDSEEVKPLSCSEGVPIRSP